MSDPFRTHLPGKVPSGFRPSVPGERRGGRKKGTPNKADASIKEMIIGALAGVGGTEYLMTQAEKNPVAFMGLIGRVLPLQVTGENGGALVIDFRWLDAPPTIDVDPVSENNESVMVTFVDTAAEATNVDTDVGEC